MPSLAFTTGAAPHGPMPAPTSAPVDPANRSPLDPFGHESLQALPPADPAGLPDQRRGGEGLDLLQPHGLCRQA